MERILGRRLLVSLAAVFVAACGQTPAARFAVDEKAAPVPPPLPGLFDEQPRPVSVLVPEDGPPAAFVSNELVVLASSAGELQSIADRLKAEVLWSVDSETSGLAEIPCFGLLRLEPPRADGDELAEVSIRLTEKRQPVNPDGRYRVTSDQGLRILALAAREAEADRQVAVNWLLEGAAIPDSTREADTVEDGLPADAYQWPHLEMGGGHDFGVTEAWSLLYRARRLDQHVRVAVIDGGFSDHADALRDLSPHDAMSIVPLRGPYGSNAGSCGGPCPWHGQNVASTLSALVDDGFGGAGSGGPVANPLLINSLYDYYSESMAVLLARGAGAKIINMSFSAPVPTIVAWTVYPFETITAAVRASGTLLFAAAGNGGANVDSGDCLGELCWEYTWYTPCENDGVICVGGLRWNDTVIDPQSNYGDEHVVVYGPYTVLAGPDPNNPGNHAHKVSGTSFSSPWMAGVAALVWAADPSLSAGDVAFAVTRATQSSPEWYRPRLRMARADKAVMWALKAVTSLVVTSPDATTEIRADQRFIVAGRIEYRTFHYSDSTQCQVTASSDRFGPVGDGLYPATTSRYRVVGQASFAITAGGLPPGAHRLTVTAHCSDSQASDDDEVVMDIYVHNTPPTAEILQPSGSGDLCAGTELMLRGTATDPEELVIGLPDSAFSWISSRAGLLGTGRSLITNRLTTPGPDTITLIVTDKYGATGSDSVAVNVLEATAPQCSDTPPFINITSPADNTVFYVMEEDAQGWYVDLTLRASASDAEDPPGTLPVSWSSDVQAALGEGLELAARLYLYSSPTTVHVITARVQDSAGHTSQDSIRVLVSIIE